MYDPISPNVNFVEQEKQIEKFWRDEKIFEKSIEDRKDGTPYVFYDGPPTANGKPHIGHVLTRVIKDMIPRYRTMKGCMVPRKAGWDTHGLPVELEVEKLLGLDGKEQIEEYGLDPFIGHCKESVWKYKGMWEDFSRTVGFWADMDDPYVTYHNEFIESLKYEIESGQVTICDSMPSFEFWLLLHFVDHEGLLNNYSQVSNILAPHIKPYFLDSTKGLKQLLKQEKHLKDSQWVKRLMDEGRIEQAVERAKVCLERAIRKEGGQSYSKVFHIFNTTT